jgi:hypothetical protein
MTSFLLDSSHRVKIAQVFRQRMQQKKEESQTTEDTTAAYLKSIYWRYRYRDDLEKILAQFINLESGYCLTCGLVHGFTNIDEARRRQNESNSYSTKNLARLFWEAAI